MIGAMLGIEAKKMKTRQSLFKNMLQREVQKSWASYVKAKGTENELPAKARMEAFREVWAMAQREL